VATSRLAQLAVSIAGFAALLFFGAPLLVQLGAVAPFVGFRTFLLGGLLAILALLLGLVALFTTRPATGRAGRGLALVASGVGAALLAAIVVAARPGIGVPPINDITTDPENPPQFSALADENAGRDMSYDHPAMAAATRSGYPDLAPIALSTDVADTVERVKVAMEGFGWNVVRVDVASGEVEATDTSRVWRFVDDIVVRVRPRPDGSRVDVRSKSRDGQGDLGANAARIRQLADALR
jgi:uncharacterized protein (DUF1499 family)